MRCLDNGKFLVACENDLPPSVGEFVSENVRCTRDPKELKALLIEAPEGVRLVEEMLPVFPPRSHPEALW